MIINSEYVLKTDNANLPLTTSEVNEYLKESFADIALEPLIPILIKMIAKYGEDFTRRVFLKKTFLNYRKCYCADTSSDRFNFELRRCKLIEVVAVKYFDADEVEQTVDSSLYSTTTSEEYSSLYFSDDFTFPSLSSTKPQPISIEFSAGYGETSASIPDNIKTAMLAHLAFIWVNRGDCFETGSVDVNSNFLERMLPPTSRLIYSMERIPDILI